jgi:hypothetical protein
MHVNTVKSNLSGTAIVTTVSADSNVMFEKAVVQVERTKSEVVVAIVRES